MSKTTKDNVPLVNRKKTGTRSPVDTQFKPGQSGNPSGRPRGSVSLISAITRMLKQIDPETGKKRLDGLALAVIEKAAAGNPQALKQIFDRLDGPIIPPVDSDAEDKDPGGLWAALHFTPEEMKELWSDMDPGNQDDSSKVSEDE